jgi:hypothetical protein
MVMIRVFVLAFMLTGCVLRGGISAHDKETDTYFRGSSMIGTVSFTQEVPDSNLEVYIQHKSLLWESVENNGDNGVPGGS